MSLRLGDSSFRADEAFGARVVQRALGVSVRQLDRKGAPRGTADAGFVYDDGRQAILEFTTLGATESFHLGHRLNALGHKLPNPGAWAWFATVGSVPELDRLQRHYARIIELLEGYGVARVDLLPVPIVRAHPELEWLVESDVDMSGHANLTTPGQAGPVWIHAGGITAVWDAQADVVTPALQAALAEEPALGHIAKLLRHEADERHLFFFVDLSGLTPEATYELVGAKRAPRDELVVPAGISHIWLCPTFGNIVTTWSSRSGWRTLEID